MLYGMVIKGHPGTGNERAVRRLQWQYPEGVTSVAEYWFGTDDPSVVATVETDDHYKQLMVAISPARANFEVV